MTPTPTRGHYLDAPVTVWPCPPARSQDSGPAVSWLGEAVDRAVTLYTRPGQTVLLVCPPSPDAAPVGRSGEDTGDWHPFDDLPETAWAVGRLGRGVRTRTGAPAPLPSGHRDVPAAWPRSGSAPGPGLREAAAGQTVPGPTGNPVGPCPDRADLVVTAVHPSASGWVHHVPWDGLLTPTGVLVVVTHSDHAGGRLVDPTGTIVAATGRCGLVLADRVVLVEVPVRRGQLAADLPGQAGTPKPGPLAGRGAARRVHSDLLLFTPGGAGKTEPGR